MLTKRLVEKVTPTDKPQKLVDERGLYLYVTPHGTKSWRYDYRFGGKRFTMTLGVIPEVSLDDARRRHLAARTKLSEEVNPAQKKRLEKLQQRIGLENTLEQVAAAWFPLATKCSSTPGVATTRPRANSGRLRSLAGGSVGASVG